MTLEALTRGNFTATITPDGDSYESPRECEISTMFGFHRSVITPDEPPSEDATKARAIAMHRDNICLPVWLFSHSGRVYKAAESNPFPCPWDSGLFGFIYISKANARKHFDVARITKHVRECMLRDLAIQVDTYSQWAAGDVYAWQVEDENGEVVESCGNYYDLDQATRDAQGCLNQFADGSRKAA